MSRRGEAVTMEGTSRSGCGVLVVEDDSEIRSVLLTALTDEGYEARGAADGAEALDVLDGWTPDVIVLDVLLKGMDAGAFRREQQSRQLAASAPVLLTTAAGAWEADRQDLGAAAFLAKPFNLDAFLGAVEQLCG
jgi:CheY-like chemotaxis protein